jgi:TPR repeat protein
VSLALQHSLMERGDMMLVQRNAVAARMLFARAADAGIGIAALKLADTNDPGFIADHNLIGIKADPLQAEGWYRKAAAMGERNAERRLKVLAGRKRAAAAQ